MMFRRDYQVEDQQLVAHVLCTIIQEQAHANAPFSCREYNGTCSDAVNKDGTFAHGRAPVNLSRSFNPVA